jgi:tetratricopeptide (TPR) repeat protein
VAASSNTCEEKQRIWNTMEEGLRVYLDHLILRQSLRYKRSEERADYVPQQQPPTLRISDLIGDHTSSRIGFLRKPDFQRATWAWTPEDCVSLLDSIINDQVIPSIIMWTSPESNLDYVLDGGHRISVVLAWLKDDWGDRELPSNLDEEQEQAIRKAAIKVRRLVEEKIGNINDYREAEEEFDRIVNEEQAPKLVLSPKAFERAQFYRKLRRGNIKFNILWVDGDYEKAEQSFLKINKTGRSLSDWETRLIENRNSSLARLVMSIANIDSAKYYWPTDPPEGSNKAQLAEKITGIIDGIGRIHKLLFQPAFESLAKGRRLQQPLLVAPGIEMKPFYLAELLTIIEGGKGQEAETKNLLKRDKEALPEEIINTGWRLTNETLSAFDHLVGPSPKSLALVPLLYFYSDGGRYVRGLLYGLMYWLLSGGNEDDILTRKKIFSAHRATFEQILLENKENVIRRIGRNIGSGPEVTYPTAKYYQGLMELLIRVNDDISSPAFEKDYKELLSKLKLPDRSAHSSQATENTSRIFSEKQKSTVVIRTLFATATRCEICGGVLDPRGGLQHDHVTKWADGGLSTIDNDRLTHPFCNNNRDVIESLKKGLQALNYQSLLIPIPLAKQSS